jgi:hypothetical protein
MTLFIATDTEGAGSGNVFPANATVDLFSISNADLGDATHAGYGEAAPSNHLVQVTYDRTDGGIPAQRLDALVNTNFHVNAQNIDIIIVACGANFTLLDGSSMLGNGTSRPVGDPDNPTQSVIVFYDTSDNNGTGICVRKQGDPAGTYSIQDPPPVILYHELSHAFHTANGDPLQLGDNGCTGSPEEQRAERDENDMRDQLGLPHRDSTDHCGNPGCQSSSCCIVASVATGSIYSTQVNALREVRDGVLRCSEIGYDFFRHLHDAYYGFSPEVCRIMARSPELLEMVRVVFVGPLTIALALLRAHGMERIDPVELGHRFEASVERAGLGLLTPADLDRGRVLLGGQPSPAASDLEVELAHLLRDRALPSPHVTWALIEPIGILIEALALRLEGENSAGIGRFLADRFDAWGVRMPVTDIWSRLSIYALCQELRFMETTTLRTAAARALFAKRVLPRLEGQAATIVALRWEGGPDGR